jgi:hypothetical protein
LRIGHRELEIHLSFPGIGHGFAFFEVVDNEYELVGVVAVNDLDIHAGVGHAASDLSQLAGLVLPQPLNQDFLNAENLDAGGL